MAERTVRILPVHRVCQLGGHHLRVSTLVRFEDATVVIGELWLNAELLPEPVKVRQASGERPFLPRSAFRASDEHGREHRVELSKMQHDRGCLVWTLNLTLRPSLAPDAESLAIDLPRLPLVQVRNGALTERWAAEGPWRCSIPIQPERAKDLDPDQAERLHWSFGLSQPTFS